MKKSKLALTALMIGITTVSGVSFAEAKLKVDDVKIIVDAKGEHKPPRPDTREAPKPPEAHRRDERRWPHDDSERPYHKQADDREPNFGPHHDGLHGPGHNKPGHDAPPPSPPHRPKHKHHW